MDGVQRKDLSDEEVVMEWFSEIEDGEPKGILIFNPYSEEFEKAVNGHKYAYALDDLDQWLRGKMKYSRLPRSMYIGYNNVRIKIRSIMDEWGVSLD